MANEAAPPSAPKASIVDLQAEIAAARAELAASIATLKGQATAGALAKRGGRALAGIFTDEHGGIRPERVAMAGAVIVGIVALRAMTRRRS
ncbi:MAG: DUF3618 domain-containing protein [Actinobacteria bacterium]|uniref:Unannotated protein n=1 Tax=freshwater metagenome TaxID=449393 RepID=A0A6J7DE65_9ZZZZ|nr:DUF3618 domain-containing protein [Actinomycetota bacterium]